MSSRIIGEMIQFPVFFSEISEDEVVEEIGGEPTDEPAAEYSDDNDEPISDGYEIYDDDEENDVELAVAADSERESPPPIDRQGPEGASAAPVKSRINSKQTLSSRTTPAVLRTSSRKSTAGNRKGEEPKLLHLRNQQRPPSIQSIRGK